MTSLHSASLSFLRWLCRPSSFDHLPPSSYTSPSNHDNNARRPSLVGTNSSITTTKQVNSDKTSHRESRPNSQDTSNDAVSSSDNSGLTGPALLVEILRQRKASLTHCQNMPRFNVNSTTRSSTTSSSTLPQTKSDSGSRTPLDDESGEYLSALCDAMLSDPLVLTRANIDPGRVIPYLFTALRLIDLGSPPHPSTATTQAYNGSTSGNAGTINKVCKDDYDGSVPKSLAQWYASIIYNGESVVTRGLYASPPQRDDDSQSTDSSRAVEGKSSSKDQMSGTISETTDAPKMKTLPALTVSIEAKDMRSNGSGNDDYDLPSDVSDDDDDNNAPKSTQNNKIPPIVSVARPLKTPSSSASLATEKSLPLALLDITQREIEKEVSPPRVIGPPVFTRKEDRDAGASIFSMQTMAARSRTPSHAKQQAFFPAGPPKSTVPPPTAEEDSKGTVSVVKKVDVHPSHPLHTESTTTIASASELPSTTQPTSLSSLDTLVKDLPPIPSTLADIETEASTTVNLLKRLGITTFETSQLQRPPFPRLHSIFSSIQSVAPCIPDTIGLFPSDVPAVSAFL